jgi:hypothetical protein
MTRVVISQPMLFPWPGFFEQLKLADVYLFLDDVQFSRGSFSNRVQLRHAEKSIWMTIPLAGKGAFQQISELRASGDDWRRTHLDQVRRSLRRAPHATDALALMETCYSKEALVDVLISSIEEPAHNIGIGEDQRRERSSRMGVGGSGSDRVLALVKSVGGTRYLTGHGAARYLDHEAFEAAGVAVEYMDYSLTPWPLDDSPFTPYVSVLDLIGLQGKDAAKYLSPRTLPWRTFLDIKFNGER